MSGVREFWIGTTIEDLEYSEVFISNRDPDKISDSDDYMDLRNCICTRLIVRDDLQPYFTKLSDAYHAGEIEMLNHLEDLLKAWEGKSEE